MRRYIFIGILLLTPLARGADATGTTAPSPAPSGSASPAPAIEWQEWSPSIFEKAKSEKKLVILDLHAVWCHWCHVMDAQTYSDPKVISLIRSKYIAIGVDQDSRPDLADRYQDYGWPATVIFDADGNELAKRRGFIPPEQMASMLQAFIDDPTPGPSVTAEATPHYATTTALSGSLRKELEDNVLSVYDPKLGSWGTGGQKFLDWNNVEYCMARAHAGDAQYEKMAKQTLAAQLALLDPVWGGVYQYSTDGDWKHPHYEKLIEFQAKNMRIYAMAYQMWKDPVYLRTAESIHRYVANFLTSPDGVFYVSQDADLVDGQHAEEYFKLNDAGRRKLGIPRVDKHLYARENGWMIQALVQMYEATGEHAYLDEAIRATKYMLEERSIPSGGWRHDADNQAGPFLGDELSMGEAMLDLYAATGDDIWMFYLSQTGPFLIDRFQPNGKDQTGVISTALSGANVTDPLPDFDENVATARFGNLLYYYTDNDQYQQLAECAMRYLTTPEIAEKHGAYVGGLLLADTEVNSAPLHIVVVGAKKDATAGKLFAAALRYPDFYKQTEWQDPKDGALHKGVTYPALPHAAAYICTDGACSAPISKPEDMAPRLDKLNKPAAAAHP